LVKRTGELFGRMIKIVKGIHMTIAELLDAAKRKQGSLGAIAERFGFHQSCLSAWRSGKRKPDASDIMLLAEMAGLPAFETLAQIEQELDAKNASVWARALGNLRAAGVAATVILTLATSLMMPSREVRAAGFSGSESTLSARIYQKTPQNQ
jgi:transcriptional regulator with XRE-family HTH domain